MHFNSFKRFSLVNIGKHQCINARSLHLIEGQLVTVNWRSMHQCSLSMQDREWAILDLIFTNLWGRDLPGHLDG